MQSVVVNTAAVAKPVCFVVDYPRRVISVFQEIPFFMVRVFMECHFTNSKNVGVMLLMMNEANFCAISTYDDLYFMKKIGLFCDVKHSMI